MEVRIQRVSSLAFVLAITTGVTPAQDIRVLTLDSSRTASCGSVDMSFVTGSAHSLVRDHLLDPARFGANGTVPRAVTFLPPVPLITPDDLADADVVLLSVQEFQPSNCETLEIVEFLRQGGGLFAFYNFAPAHYGTRFGGAFSWQFGNAPGSVVDPASTVASGPFGSVSGSIGNLNTHFWFDDVGPHGNAVVASNGPVFVEFTWGAGRALVVGDDEWCMNVSFCGTAQLPNLEREALFLNGFRSVVPPVGFQYVPASQSLGTNYCGSVPNSSGLVAHICAVGSSALSNQDVRLDTSWVPATTGYFLMSQGTANVPGFGGSQGVLCLGGGPTIYRFTNYVLQGGSSGVTVSLEIPWNDMPSGIQFQPGETWNFQYWFRDSSMGQSTSNTSNGLSILFQ